MLKNLKVGTKLFAILVAPVLVLVGLTVVGVRQRLQDANDARRVEELTNFSAVNAKLIEELQIEGIASATYGSTNKAQGKPALDEQRKKTDAALNEYKSALGSVDPGRDPNASSVRDALKQADTRINSLTTIRRSVDAIQTDPMKLVEQYTSTTTDLLSVNRTISQTVNDPNLARSLASFVNLETLTNTEAKVASLLTISVEITFYAKKLPTAADPKAERLDELGEGCGTNAAGAGDACPIYKATVQANTELAQAEDIFDQAATGEHKQIKRFADAGSQYDELKRNAIEDGVGQNDLSGVEPGTTAVSPEQWRKDSVDRIVKLYDAQRKILVDSNESVLKLAQAKASDAQKTMVIYILFSVGAIVVAGGLTILVGRAITVPLRKLTSAAYILSTERLPALVERLRNPEEDTGESLAATLTPIDINSKDEIGQLADSFNSIQQVTVEVAEEQSVLLRKGIGDIFINLARRNQTLLDRQIEFIDQLEANEEDPDQLDNLFKLDHLATRMRRNAESLLVLAGAEPPRRRGRPVALADVVRVAIGEVEDFARIQLLALDDATVGGNVAVDLAHLLSELMENATHFSPPDTMVEIVGHRADNGYIISVSDQGIGMSTDQLSEANQQLARPPLVGLALSRSLGFIVIGRLAQRFEISVKLTASPSGGVTALVNLPPDLVTFEGDELPRADADETQYEAAYEDVAALPEVEPELVDFDDEVVVLDDEVVVLDDEEPAFDDEPVLLDDDEPILYETEEVELGEFEVEEFAVDELEDTYLTDVLAEEGISETDEFERGLQAIISDELEPGPVEDDTPGVAPAEPATFPSLDEESVPGAFGTVVDEEPPAPVIEAEPEPEPVIEAEPEPAVAEARTFEPIITEAERITAAARAEAKEAEMTAAGLVRRTPKKRSATPVHDGTSVAQQPRTTGSNQRSPEEVRKMLSRYRSGLNKGRGSADSEKTDS